MRLRLVWLLLPWLLINLLQAYFTGLFHDEAYYFFYSRDLAWGYYDHPPLTALMIRLGFFITHNALGVRLLFTLLSLGTITLLYKLTEAKNTWLFAVLASSYMIFQITGFMALPDSLLVFFSVLFLIVYKRYSESGSLTDALWLGMVMAGLFYSKYLGILLVFFTVLSNLKLLKKPSFWLAVGVTTLLFLPHLLWQYQNDFPSLYYHLRERSHDEVFRWTNFGDYIVGQFAQTNPFLFIPIVILLIRFKAGNAYDRALKFAALGCLALPLLLMVRGRVEANWTMTGLVPLFIIAYRAFESRKRYHRYVYFSGAFTLAIVLFLRAAIAFDFLPEKYTRQALMDLRGWDKFSKTLAHIAGERPVVFVGTYQLPSQYIFSTSKQAFSFNNALYRKNQYDLEGIEEKLQGKEVLVINPKSNVGQEDVREYRLEFADSLQLPNGRYRPYFIVENYRSYNFIECDIHLPDETFHAGQEVNIPVTLRNPGREKVDFSQAYPARVHLTYFILQYGKPVVYEKVEELSGKTIEKEYSTAIPVRLPEKPGIYYLKVSIKSGWLPAGINSRLLKLKVE
jgi:hypothetical protein